MSKNRIWRRLCWLGSLGVLALGLTAARAEDISLATLVTPKANTFDLIVFDRTETCAASFKPNDSLVKPDPVPLPASGGATYTSADIKRWNGNIRKNKYIVDNDVAPGSPGDWSRIKANAAEFFKNGEPDVIDFPANGHNRRETSGALARDAAFLLLMRYDTLTRNRAKLKKVADYLIEAAGLPINDFTPKCFRELDDSAPYDAYYEHAAWFMRYAAAYDYVRARLAVDQRRTIENYIRRQAYFFAAHLDWNLNYAFDHRLEGIYTPTWGSEFYSGPIYKVKKDTNGDCSVDGPENDIYLYVNADKTLGPLLRKPPMWFNNRKSAAVLAFSVAGFVLNDEILYNRGQRYVMEWLTYGVFADMTDGEYSRNGDYCIAGQGAIYAIYNTQAAVLLSHWMKQRGHDGLTRFSTQGGMWGTASPDAAKSIESVMLHHFSMMNGQTKRYYHENWKANNAQEPREATLIWLPTQRANNGWPADIYHELAFLTAASSYPNAPIAGMVMRDPLVTPLALPGATGNAVATGNGKFNDVFGMLPAVLLLR